MAGNARTCVQGTVRGLPNRVERVSQRQELGALPTWSRATAWRKLADAVNQYLEKGSQVFVECELRGEASDGSQNPCIWFGTRHLWRNADAS
jgi:hypothetical protein